MECTLFEMALALLLCCTLSLFMYWMADKKGRLDLPRFEKVSRLLPGPERIRENVLVQSPITAPPDGGVRTMLENLQRACAIDATRPFVGEIRDGEYHWSSYAEVAGNAKDLGSGVVHLGIAPGEETRVGIAGINSVRYSTALWSLVSYSMVLVPLYHNSKIETLCEIIDNCKLQLVYCDNEKRAAEFIAIKKSGKLPTLRLIIVLNGGEQVNGEVEGAGGLQVFDYEHVLSFGRAHSSELFPPKPESTYIICHTSGTTGRPKGVMMSHRGLLAAMAGLYTQWCVAPHKMVFDHNDIFFSFLSLAHIYEHLMQSFTIYACGRIGIYGGDVSQLMGDIRLLHPTIISLVPRLLNKLYDSIHASMEGKNAIIKNLFHMAKKAKLSDLRKGVQRYDTVWDKVVFKKVHALIGGRVRLLTTGGAPVTPAVMEFTRIAFGCPLFEGYGQTECSAAGTLNIPSDTSTANVGGPAPWAQVKLVDVPDLGYMCADDKGEVCFRGAAVMDGYFDDEELSRKTVDEDGWLHTGDIGMWLPNGALKIIDRKNALFKLAQGDFVSPEQIETVYLQSPIVNQIFVVGQTTRSFLVAIAVVDVKALRGSLEKSSEEKTREAACLSDGDMLSHCSARQHALSELTRMGKERGLQTIEQIHNIHLVTEELTAESGLLTPTLKIRRHLLRAKFEKEIEAMYAETKNL